MSFTKPGLSVWLLGVSLLAVLVCFVTGGRVYSGGVAGIVHSVSVWVAVAFQLPALWLALRELRRASETLRALAGTESV